MTKFRKKPVVIEAVQWTGDNVEEVQAFVRGGEPLHVFPPERPHADPEVTASVYDVLHSSWVGVKTGHWIVRGVAGELYPIAPDVLAATYDVVEESS